MPLCELRIPRTVQPDKPTQINWSHPLTRDLVVCAIPVGPRFYECVTGQLSGAAGTVKVRAAVDGNRSASKRIVNPGTASKLANPTGADSIVGAYSVFAECSPETNSVANQPIFASLEESNGYGFMVGVDDAGAEFNAMRSAHLYIFGTAGGATSGQILLADSELYSHRIMWTWDTSSTRFYAKRALGTTVAGTTTAPTAASTRRGYFLTGVAGIVGQAAASLVLVWNRTLSLEEYQALHDNPWQVFVPQLQANNWTALPGGGAFTFPANQGSFALTGQTASLLFNRALTAEYGGFALTGQDVTLQKDTPGQFTLQVDAGSYSWNGNDALVDYAMNADVGSFALTGQEVTFSIGVPAAYTLSVDPGYYTFNGQNARLDWSGAPIVPNRQAGIYMGMRIGL